jgi:hypothetical protein
MSVSRDWVRLEAELSRLLPGVGGEPSRPQLLATLADYSAAATREARLLGPIVPSAGECSQALEWLLRPVFVCGHHRSGTTLLQNLLDGHPQLLVLPSEGTYFTSFSYVARAVQSGRAMDRFAAEWIARCVDPNFEPHFRLGMSDAGRNPAVEFARQLFGWHEALRDRVPSELVPLLALAAAFRAATAPAGAPQRWVEKTPRNERYAERFSKIGGARFIQLVRDPRATLASLAQSYRASGSGRFDAAEHARAIAGSLRLAAANKRRLGKRYLVLRYEDLVERPALEMAVVRQFLDIARDPALLLPSAGGRPVRANSSFDARPAGIIEPRRGSADLPAEQLALLEAFAAGAARPFGYGLAAAPRLPRLATRLRHWPRHVLRSGRRALGMAARRLAR